LSGNPVEGARRTVLEALEVVYENDAVARREDMSPAERLEFHQAHSQAEMTDLNAWVHRQFDEQRVEPNSALGAAVRYLLKHWEKLTLFLRKAGTPLDNNLCERALKRRSCTVRIRSFSKRRTGLGSAICT
jgi:hypothetical protein